VVPTAVSAAVVCDLAYATISRCHNPIKTIMALMAENVPERDLQHQFSGDPGDTG
jgi:hypothetical protein